MKFGMGSNAERTQKIRRVKVQNDIRTSIYINKHPRFSIVLPLLRSLANNGMLVNDGNVYKNVMLMLTTINECCLGYVFLTFAK